MLKISVIIPTYNGSKTIRALLDGIFEQTIQVHEVIIIDSSSTDGTQSIIQEFINQRKSIIFRVIPKSEFSHSQTRNNAAKIASGEIIVFTVQDAEPFNNEWLSNLIKPFNDSIDTACVFCRHVPRNNANPMIKRNIQYCFDAFKRDEQNYTHQNKIANIPEYESNKQWYWFNSDVCSAVRRSIFLQIKFDDVPYAEDQIFGKRIIEAGYTKTYSDNAMIIHSHQYNLWASLKRNFDENRGMSISTGEISKVNFFTLIPRIIWNWWGNMIYINRTITVNKMFWFTYSLGYEVVHMVGLMLGKHFAKMPSQLQRILSLEGNAYGKSGKLISKK